MAVYLLSKRLPRREIIFAKAAAILVAGCSSSPRPRSLPSSRSTVPTARARAGIPRRYGTWDLPYITNFVLLSVATSRPLVFGLDYVFIWEGLLGDLFTGTRYLSIRQYRLGIADGIATVPERVFQAELDGLSRSR